MKFVGFVVLFVVSIAHAEKETTIVAAERKAIEITKSLSNYFAKNQIDIKEIEAGINGYKGTAVRSLSCKIVKVNLPNGNEDSGARCRVGLDSGFNITFDSNLNPIRIAHFVP